MDLDVAAAAVAEGKLSDNQTPDNPFVGAVIVKDGVELGRAHRGQTGEGDHAEYGLLKMLAAEGVSVEGATVYTTLEPCSYRKGEDKIPCAHRLVQAGVAEVVIGMYDPNPRIYRDGWRILRDAGVKLDVFPPELREEVEADNAAFIEPYVRREADADTGVLFDWDHRSKGFEVVTSGATFWARFTGCSANSLYLMGGHGPDGVGTPRHATKFEEVVDPEADGSWRHAREVREGGLGILRGVSGHLLIKVTEVHDMDRGAVQNCVEFDFEFRPSAGP